MYVINKGGVLNQCSNSGRVAAMLTGLEPNELMTAIILCKNHTGKCKFPNVPTTEHLMAMQIR